MFWVKRARAVTSSQVTFDSVAKRTRICQALTTDYLDD